MLGLMGTAPRAVMAAAAAEVDVGGAVRACMTSKSRLMRRASSGGSTGVWSSLWPTRGWLMSGDSSIGLGCAQRPAGSPVYVARLLLDNGLLHAQCGGGAAVAAVRARVASRRRAWVNASLSVRSAAVVSVRAMRANSAGGAAIGPWVCSA